MECVFCNLLNSKENRIVLENDYAFAIFDRYPVSEGHSLVIPKRHIVSFFELETEELIGIYALMQELRDYLVSRYNTQDFNIGINEGRAAGRTIDHLHIHVIPRYTGDVEMPAGGVRHIIAKNKEFYKEIMEQKI